MTQITNPTLLKAITHRGYVEGNQLLSVTGGPGNFGMEAGPNYKSFDLNMQAEYDPPEDWWNVDCGSHNDIWIITVTASTLL